MRVERHNGAFTCFDINALSMLIIVMIKSFRCKETEKLFNRQQTRRLPADILRIALRKLAWLDSATSLEDLRLPPGNRLETLKGDRLGEYSLRINDQFRVCFSWDGSDAYNVEIVDYH